MRALIFDPDNVFGDEHPMMPADESATKIYKECKMRDGELYMSHRSISKLGWMVIGPCLVIAAD